MRKIVLFIAMSLDGYIADRNGGVGWLRGHGDDSENVDVYSRFIRDVGREIELKLLKTQTYNGITDLVYTRR